MSEVTRYGRKWMTAWPWMRVLSALALMSALGLTRGPRALAQDIPEGERLVEREDPLNLVEKLDCQGTLCVWRTSIYNPCSGEYCKMDSLYVTDRDGRVVREHGRIALGEYTREVRFIAPGRLEFLDHKGPFRPGRELGSETGVDQSWVQREVWILSPDGKTLTRDPKAVREPAWKRWPRAASARPSRQPHPHPSPRIRVSRCPSRKPCSPRP
ncbi:hypothetical protein F0U59_35950 [Archangium gephyra]|nr:hypothetical protein F0U59_35950 [Archangium gephyra]